MYTAINFIALIMLMYFLLKKPLAEAFVSRHNNYAKEVDEARTMLAQGRSKFEEFSSKLKSIESELDFIKKTTEKEAEVTASKIVMNAQNLSQGLVGDAKDRAKNLARNFIKEETIAATDRVIGEAEKIITQKITKDDHRKFQSDFSSRVAGGIL